MKRLDIKLVIGLPGSGKTIFVDGYDPKQFMVIDDISVHSEKLEEVSDRITKLVITDIHCCNPEIEKKAIASLQEKFKQRKLTLEVLYFENNPDKCWTNIQNRNDGRKISKNFLYYLSSIYKPSGKMLPVYTPHLHSI